MSHEAIFLVASATFVFGLLVWGSVFSVQKTSAIYEDCDGRRSNKANNITCTGSYRESSGVTLNDLFQRSTFQSLTHNDMVMKNMNLYPHDTNIPFLLPFP